MQRDNSIDVYVVDLADIMPPEINFPKKRKNNDIGIARRPSKEN